MPVVPTYEDRGIRLDPGLNFRDSTKATGEMFGSQVGEALGKAGQGLTDLGKAVAEVHELDATNTAKDSSNTTMGGFREATYGKNGYMSTTGRAAVEGLDGYRKSLLQLAQDGAKGLSPLAARKYWDATNVSINSLMDDASKHAMQERKTWSGEASNQRVAAFTGNAAAQPDNPQGWAQNTFAAAAEVGEQGRMAGLTHEEIQQVVSQTISKSSETTVLELAKTSAIAAADLYQSGKLPLSDDARKRLDATVGKAAEDERTLLAGMAFATGTRMPGEVPPIPGVSGESGVTAAGPTRQKAFLLDRTAGTNGPAVLNLDNAFATNLAALIEDAPDKVREGLGIGFRKGADDQHGEARAADLTYHGRSLDQAPTDVQDWLRRNAGQYGLSLPIGGGPGGSVVASTDGVAARALRPSAEAIDKHLQTIADPRRREIARQAIMTTLDQQSRQEQDQQQAAKAELWKQVDAGMAPDALLPYTIRQAAGSNAMTVARNYVSTARSGPVISDDVLLRDMRLFAAVRPEDFTQVDLNDYRDRLEKSDLKALTETQSAIGRDSRKARDAGAELKNAFDMARTRLENAGALSPGEESADERMLLAHVQNAVYSGLADFHAANPGRRPTPADICKSVDRFVMPYYLPQPDPRPKPPVKLSDISPDLRTSITRQLAMELGRKPTDGEVAREYAAYRQSQLG